MNSDIEISGPLQGQGQVCATILADVPEWFGIEEANRNYAKEAESLPTFVATMDNEPVEFMTLKTHAPEAAELYVLAVLKRYHRQGIGKLLLDASEAYLRSEGVRFLQVKTLAADADDENYAKTRRFYQGQGYVTLEVFPDLWDPQNPALQMIKAL